MGNVEAWNTEWDGLTLRLGRVVRELDYRQHEQDFQQLVARSNTQVGDVHHLIFGPLDGCKTEFSRIIYVE